MLMCVCVTLYMCQWIARYSNVYVPKYICCTIISGAHHHHKGWIFHLLSQIFITRLRNLFSFVFNAKKLKKVCLLYRYQNRVPNYETKLWCSRRNKNLRENTRNKFCFWNLKIPISYGNLSLSYRWLWYVSFVSLGYWNRYSHSLLSLVLR